MDTSGLTLQQELELLHEYWPQVNAVKHLTAAGLSVLVYDLFLTFPAEVALIWRPRRVSLPKAAYIINRYGAIALLSVFMSVSEPSRIVSNAWCARTLTAVALMILCVDAIGHALALFRIFLLWNRNQYILRLMVAGASFAYVVCFTFAALFVKDFPKDALFNAWPLNTCFVNIKPKLLMGVFIPEVLLDIYAAGLVFFNAMDRPRAAGQKILNILQHDGLFLILATFFLRTLNFALCFASNQFLATIGISFIEAVITAINARLFLMLYTTARAAAAHSHNSNAPELEYFSEHEFDDVRSTYSEVDVGKVSNSRPGSSKGQGNGPPAYYVGAGGNGKVHPPKGAKGKGSFGEPLGEVYVMTERATKAL